MKPTFNPSSSEHLRCPFPTLAALREESPIFFLNRPPSPMWVVTRYNDVKALLNHEALSLNLNDEGNYARIAGTGQQTPHQI